MSAYAIPGLFPPLTSSFHNQLCLTPATSSLDAAYGRKESENKPVEVIVKGARIDTATLIHSLLSNNNQQPTTTSRKRRTRSTTQSACYQSSSEEEAVLFDLVVDGIHAYDDSGVATKTITRTHAQFVQLYHELLEEHPHGQCGHFEESRNPSTSSTTTSSTASMLPPFPRLQDQENSLFPSGVASNQEAPTATGVGLIVLQEMLRFQVPLLQEWLNAILKRVDLTQSVALKHFLREGPERFTGMMTLGPSSSASFGSACVGAEKLVPIEESDTEYEFEEDCFVVS